MTGFGKSAIYITFPSLYELSSVSQRPPKVVNPAVIIISPLIALMDDQVKECAGFGVAGVKLPQVNL